MRVDIPQIQETPKCQNTYKNFVIREIRSKDKRIKEKDLRSIISFDIEEPALIIETNDPVYMGNVITI